MAQIRGPQIQDDTITQDQLALVSVGTPEIILGAVGPTQANLALPWTFVAQPTCGQVPGAVSDLTNKAYVDAIATGLSDFKSAVKAATTAALPANNRVANVLTGAANGALPAQDTIALLVGDRFLVKDEVIAQNNGIYEVTATGNPGAPWVLTRTSDADTSAEVNAGMYMFVDQGATNGDDSYVLATNDPIVLNTTPLTFVKFSGTGQITAGAGLVKVGDTIDFVAADASLNVQANDVAVVYGVAGNLASVDAGDAANAGVQVNAARTDHQHAVSTGAPTVTIKSEQTAAGVGVATTMLRSDAQIQAATAAPAAASVSSDAAAVAQGNASTMLRSNATLTAATATAVALTTANARGASELLARADHTHQGFKLAIADKAQNPATTGAANDVDTLLTLSATPALLGYVQALVNGVQAEVGNAVKTKDCYFSGDNGVTARAFGAAVFTDKFYWNGIISGYGLINNTDEVDFNYTQLA
jgi:hypothetical protein